jgi:ferredoxin
MPYVITDLCIRDGACASVCPVDCIVPGYPIEEWPHYYIDPESCIDCSACVSECPNEAIFQLPEIPAFFKASKDCYLSRPVGTPGYEEAYKGEDADGKPVILLATRLLKQGETADLSPAIAENADFFNSGPGYSAIEK